MKVDIRIISDAEIKIGIKKTIKNCKSLIQDGDILFQSERFPRAFALYQFANEELGKAVLLFSLLIWRKTNKPIDYKSINRDLTDHIPKHRISNGIILNALSNNYSEKKEGKKDILKETITKINSAEEYNSFKNDCLYTSFVQNSIKTPEEIITKEQVIDLKMDALKKFQIYTTDIEKHLEEIEEISKLYNEFEVDPKFDEEFIADLNNILNDNK